MKQASHNSCPHGNTRSNNEKMPAIWPQSCCVSDPSADATGRAPDDGIPDSLSAAFHHLLSVTDRPGNEYAYEAQEEPQREQSDLRTFGKSIKKPWLPFSHSWQIPICRHTDHPLFLQRAKACFFLHQQSTSKCAFCCPMRSMRLHAAIASFQMQVSFTGHVSHLNSYGHGVLAWSNA